MPYRSITLALFCFIAAASATLAPRPAAAQTDPLLKAALHAEHRLKARVGYSVIDTGSGRTWQYRSDERFPMASTVKALVCAALLKQGQTALEQPVLIRQRDILDYAPVTKHQVGTRPSASQLCAITLRSSDNTAVNAVLQVLGGPQAVTAFLRQMGDQTTQVDRDEPSLNEGRPGDRRDTTTPRAMAHTLRALVLGTVLDKPSSEQLKLWLMDNEVGGPLLRAGVPQDWQIADRTGSGGFGTRGVVAVMWPPQRAPVIAAIYLTETTASLQARNAAIASLGRAIALAVAQ